MKKEREAAVPHGCLSCRPVKKAISRESEKAVIEK